MPARKIVTIHAPMAKGVTDKILAPVIELMETFGFPWWLSHEPPDISLLIGCHEEWTRRGPSEDELAHFFELWEAGETEQAQEFARHGGFGPASRKRR